jgi:hypothetical protein
VSLLFGRRRVSGVADTDKPEVVRPDDDESCPQGECAPWAEGTTRYSVTDLVLHSAEDLTALAAALEDRGMTITQRALQIAEEAREWFRIAADERMWVFQGGFCGESFDGPEMEIAAMLAVVESLDPQARALWDGCSRREFDFAYDCGVRPFAVHHDLSAGTLARLAAAGGSLRITLCALDPREIKNAEPGAAADPAM